MTPLIAEMVACVAEKADEWTWFDIDEVWKSSIDEYVEKDTFKGLLNPLPFRRCAIVAENKYNEKFSLVITEAVAINVPAPLKEGQRVTSVAGFKLGTDKKVYALPLFSFDPFTYSEDSKKMIIHFDKPEYGKNENLVAGARYALMTISFWLELLNTEKVAVHTAAKKANHAKRIRQGKKPMFDWHTVVLEPRSQKSEYLGGTHSSPRLHDVRGHWVVRGNKKFWRKPHKRGDASKGVIFHDYKLKGEKSESISKHGGPAGHGFT
jgi:hypothetical protein